MSAPEAEVARAGGALATLIHQFSDPLSFYRELVQNALDAGSRHVQIGLTYEDGRAQITVEDGGQGMTAHVIDTQLTRLFASKKDGDFTRIGKFGIGFVSVFALQPERVTLETSCEGEGWLVEFLEDGQFERRPLREPREGTLIRLFKSMSQTDFDALVASSRKTVLYWCKHVSGEIWLNGERLNRRFDVKALVVYRWSEPDTEIVLGYPEDAQSFVGFYNQGLTLMESQTEHIWPGLAVKANSRYLEHTLTRDNLVLDDNFHKVAHRVQEMVEKELPTYLLSRLAQPADRPKVFPSLLCHFGWQRVRLWDSQLMGHLTGEADGSLWTALPGRHNPGLIAVGTAGLAGLMEPPNQAVFILEVPPDQHTPPDLPVCTCAIIDFDERTVLQEKKLVWGDFRPAYGAHSFLLPCPMLPGQKVSFRVDWHGHTPLTFHALDLRRRTTREMSLSAEQLEIPVFLSPTGEGIALSTLRAAHQARRCWFAAGPSPLTERLLADEHLVVVARPETMEWEFARLVLGDEPRRAELELVSPVEVESPPAHWDILCEHAARLLAAHARVELKELRWASPACEQDWFALLLPRLDGVFPLQLARSREGVVGPGVLVLNSEHELAHRLLTLAGKEPHVAAYLACKQFLAQAGLSAEDDAQLARLAWSGRR